MTKDWDSVQEEIKDLSFAQKRPLEEVKELMERKYKFRASTRAYRMKLKEWGLMRHKARRAMKARSEVRDASQPISNDDDEGDRDSSATAKPVPIDITPVEHRTKTGGWQVVADLPTLMTDIGTVAEPAFMDLLNQPQGLQPSFDPWPQARTQASEIVLDMVAAVLESDAQKLETIIVKNINHVNNPIGMLFDTPNSRFFNHAAMNKMFILQHPDQTLFDIACGMPCGPIIWILLAHGAKGSKHPLGTDLALHNAIKNGRVYTVQALLVPGRSNVNGVPGTTWRPLLQAVFWNVPDVVRILLSRGAKTEVSGHSPNSTGTHTALQLCLEHRANNYMNLQARERCHQILEMLLTAGADIHVMHTEPYIQSTLDAFIKPWKTRPYWAMGLSAEELECLRLFVGKGANLQVQLDGCPCGSTQSKTFEHQVLWHSTPSVARLLVDSFVPTPTSSGSSLLHEVLGSCLNAKRHPADTLRDIQVLLEKGADPNLADADGLIPLRKCIEQCPAVDLVARLQMLLDAGADPAAEDSDGIQPYILAARTFEEPLLSEVMQAMVSKMPGRYARHVDGVSHTWPGGHFPISENQTYEQVMSCTRQMDEFKLNMRSMVPDDVQSVFQRAYFSVVSKNFLDTMTRVVKSKMLDAKEKDQIVWIVSMREGVNLPEYKFDQKLVIAFLDHQPIPTMMLETGTDISTANAMTYDTSAITPSSPASSVTVTADTISPIHTPFQFNPNNSTGSVTSPGTPKSSLWLDDFLVTSTTQIRWLDPCARPKPGDAKKALKAVLNFKCAVCDNGKLLTKKELERHETEHSHSRDCDIVACTRRFCTGKRNIKDVGCQDYLFMGGV
ncbi:ankyrin [Clathrospora elynae]|uniref:Ankyrin n=1 Tax=Clathrospora elynae TaxID=706981 RepID=A0A6A5SST8_9PLEO|nr:ankyrin [Clathrospora elynae]